MRRGARVDENKRKKRRRGKRRETRVYGTVDMEEEKKGRRVWNSGREGRR